MVAFLKFICDSKYVENNESLVLLHYYRLWHERKDSKTDFVEKNKNI